MDINYNFYEKYHIINFKIRKENTDVIIDLAVDEENSCLGNISSLTSGLPQDGITALQRKINEINNNTSSTACLYIDNENNRMGAQSVIYAESKIDKDVFQDFLEARLKCLTIISAK